MQRDLAPFRRAIHHQDHVANLGGLQGSARDARFLDQQIDLDQAGKIKAPAHAPEFPNLARQLLLALNPVAIRRGSKRGNPLLPERRRGVSAQQLPQSIELQHPRRTWFSSPGIAFYGTGADAAKARESSEGGKSSRRSSQQGSRRLEKMRDEFGGCQNSRRAISQARWSSRSVAHRSGHFRRRLSPPPAAGPRTAPRPPVCSGR